MRNVLKKRRGENKITRFTFNNFVFENRAVYEIMWENVVQPGREQVVIWRVRISCRLTKATQTHTHAHTLRICNIIALLLQKWLHKRFSMLFDIVVSMYLLAILLM
jgi:hypothetical protein